MATIQSTSLNTLVSLLSNDKKAFSFEVITVTTTVQNLNIPNNASYAIIQVENGAGATSTSELVRFKYSGTPSATEGLILGHLDTIDLSDAETLNNFRFVLLAGVGHKLNVQYFK